MALPFTKQKPADQEQQQLKHSLDALSTTVESINARLSGTPYDTTTHDMLQQYLPIITNQVGKLFEQQQQMVQSVDEMRTQWEQFQKDTIQYLEWVGKTAQHTAEVTKQSIDMFADSQKESQKELSESFEHLQDKLQESVQISVDEAKVIREQNAIFLRRLEEEEQTLQKAALKTKK